MGVRPLTTRSFSEQGEAQPAPPARAAAAARLLPGALLLLLWLGVIPPSGGYFPRDWYPAALGIVLVFCVLCLTYGAALPSAPAARRALLIFAALVAWAFLSMAWSGSRSDAWEEADQLIFYLAAAGAATLVPWTPRTLAIVTGAWSLGVAALCAGRLFTWLGARDVLVFFSHDGRLNDPIGYPNAAAALPALALFPALAISSLRTAPRYVRALALPVAVFLAEFSLMPESRGAILGTLLALPILVAAAPDRGRLLARIAVVALLLAPAASALVAFGNSPNDHKPPGPALDKAASWLLVGVVAGLVLGVALALLDDRVRGPRVTRRGLRAAGAVVVAGIIAVAAIFGPRAVSYVHDTWESASTPVYPGGQGRLLSFAPEERPDYARVSLHALADHPIAGLGAGNFGREYDARRTLEKHSRYPHNLVLRAAGEGGVVGLLLFLGLVGALIAGLIAARARLDATGRAVVAAVGAMGTYFLIHGEVDWLEAFPALVLPVTGLAFAVLALAGPRRPPRAWPPWARRTALAAGGAVLGAVVVSLGAPYLSERYVERARTEWTAAQTAAFDDLDRAARWNPVSPAPAINQGALALQLGQYKRAARCFRRALAREENWVPYLELALIEAHNGRFPAARQLLDRAAALDREDPVISEARTKISHKVRVDPGAVNAVARQGPLFTSARFP